MDIAMTMHHIDKYTTEHLDTARQEAQKVLRSQQDEPADYTDFLSVVTETLNVGLPFVRAQVNQVLMTPRAPFNSQVLKLIKGLTADTLVNEGGAFHLANEVNRLITLFLPYLTVRDIKVYRNDGQLESDAPFQLIIEFFDKRSNMADKVKYDLRLKDNEPTYPSPLEEEQEEQEEREDPKITRVRDILENVNGLRRIIENLPENCKNPALLKAMRKDFSEIITAELPNLVFHGFHITYNGAPHSRILNVMLSEDGPVFVVAVQVANMKKEISPEVVKAVETMTQDEALQELATFGQTHQPETYAKTDGPDFKSDDPFFFRGKLIRDLIPTDPNDTDVETDPVRLRVFLVRKLFEELGEAQASNFSNPHELGDVIDVLYALGKQGGQSAEKIDELRALKLLTRGGFNTGRVWIDPDKA